MQVPEENFVGLLKLLRLKRYEAPPRGFYEEFPNRVRRAIEMQRHSVIEEWKADLKWERKLFAFLEAKPLVIGLVGGAVCLLTLMAILYSQRVAVEPQLIMTPGPVAQPMVGLPPSAESTTAKSGDGVQHPLVVTNPLPAAVQNPWLNLQPVMWQRQGNF